jgi:ethanolamine ammonia-lyase small subunit
MPSTSIQHDSWFGLTRFTSARIALGRVGHSLPTETVLAFDCAHALARDAIFQPLNTQQLLQELKLADFPAMHVASQITGRQQYLLRPDLGRKLHPQYRTLLTADSPPPSRLTIVLADGLSALAVARHALPVLQMFRAISQSAWELDTIILATQARVALADEIAALRGAVACAIFIGERPGLSTADSMGIYVTYEPRIGRTDAERNCISNIHAAGLQYEEAAQKLTCLLRCARLLGKSGIALKDTAMRKAEGISVLPQE